MHSLIHDTFKAAQALIEGAWRIAMYQRYNARRPFGWTTRHWVEEAAKGKTPDAAFAARDKKRRPEIFVPRIIQTPAQHDATPAITFGAGRAKTPYYASSRINIAGMSYGALSKSAIKSLADGAAHANCWLNSGEGALSPYHTEAGCDIILQIGAGKFGLCDEAGTFDEAMLVERCSNPNIKMIEVKLSQGAKPGKGGYLSGDKVRGGVAELLNVPEGTDVFTQTHHDEVTDFPSLFAWLHHLRTITGKPVGFKCAATNEDGWQELCEAFAQLPRKELPDFIAIDGGNAGTGGAPQTLMQSVGFSLKRSLPKLHQQLIEYGLREEIKLVASGNIITPDQATAALNWGADALALGRGAMLAMGCVQALQCHRNVCPMGITAHNPILEARFHIGIDKGLKVGNYIKQMNEEVQMLEYICPQLHTPQGVNKLRKK